LPRCRVAAAQSCRGAALPRCSVAALQRCRVAALHATIRWLLHCMLQVRRRMLQSTVASARRMSQNARCVRSRALRSARCIVASLTSSCARCINYRHAALIIGWSGHTHFPSLSYSFTFRYRFCTQPLPPARPTAPNGSTQSNPASARPPNRPACVALHCVAAMRVVVGECARAPLCAFACACVWVRVRARRHGPRPFVCLCAWFCLCVCCELSALTGSHSLSGARSSP
jgi:hypothetical protein